MMKLNGSIILVLAIFAAVIVAGCTSSSPGPTATTATAGGATVTPGATSAPSGGGLNTLASAFDTSKVKWFAYQMTMPMITTPMTVRMDFGVDYNGTKATKYTTNMNMSGTTIFSEMYVNPTTNAILGGHSKTTINGQTTDTPIQPQAAANTTGSSSIPTTPFGTYGNNTLTNAGPDSVTVPAGTYACTKYTYTAQNQTTGSVWVSSGVPVPIKYEGSSGGQTVSMELTGWG